MSLLPAHSRLSEDNWKLFFLRTLFLSFSFILIVYRVLEAFSLNATLIFTLIIIILCSRKIYSVLCMTTYGSWICTCIFYVRCRLTAITELNDCSVSQSDVNWVTSTCGETQWPTDAYTTGIYSYTTGIFSAVASLGLVSPGAVTDQWWRQRSKGARSFQGQKIPQPGHTDALFS